MQQDWRSLATAARIAECQITVRRREYPIAAGNKPFLTTENAGCGFFSNIGKTRTFTGGQIQDFHFF
jgi:hypothetical protein